MAAGFENGLGGAGAGAGGGPPPPPPPPASDQDSSHGGTVKRPPRESTKGKAIATASGTRFQCPRCPKNFSRIENLTRHQANHDDVGRFACVLCRKRFTRSDLLNRHRKIHTNSHLETNAHVTKTGSPHSDPRGLENIQQSSSIDGRASSDAGSSHVSSQSPNSIYPAIPAHQSYHPTNHGEYHSPFQPVEPPRSAMLPPQPQGLTSLMEAALAPQEAFQFTPVDSINPLLWDGFMRFGDNTNAYMGSYDADMSWTLDYLPSENSPNSLNNMDMVGQYEDWGDSAYQRFPQISYPQPPMPDGTEDAEGDDEEQGDWPDKVSRQPIPDRPVRIIPQFRPFSWQPLINEATASGLLASVVRPFQIINEEIRGLLLSTLNGTGFRTEISRPEISEAIFPPAHILDYFLRLYIRHVHPRFRILHLPTFELYKTSPLLLLAMMFLGSSHSGEDRGRFSRLFHEHLRLAVTRAQEMDRSFMRSTDNILTYFLLCLAGTWSGNKTQYEFAEGGRGILVTACRRARLLDCRASARVPSDAFLQNGVSHIQASWLAWIETEKRKRLGLSIYIYDCQYPALFNNQPYVSKAETTNCVFPCAEEFWEAPTCEDWKGLLGPAEMPSCTYYLHALNSCLLRKWIKPPPAIVHVSEIGKIILMYALHTHIFEWRQSTSMLNPTGLMGTFGNSAHDMGEGLRERRRWLKDGLDSFAECYSTPSTSPATLLLHHLGYIALDVSLSDIHLIAGRSTNLHDSSFAEENLKYWANSEIADNTMSHVYQMLELAHFCVENGTAVESSFEVSVCLFTGGMVCWAFGKLRRGGMDGGGYNRDDLVGRVRRASGALKAMACWRMGGMFGRILNGFEGGKGKRV